MRIYGPPEANTLESKDIVGKEADGAQKVGKATKSQSVRKSDAKTVGDGVVLSETAKATAAELTRLELERADYVQSIKAQVQDGSYQIDFDHLADQLIAEELGRAGK